MGKEEASLFQLLYVTLVSTCLSVTGFGNTLKLLAVGKYLKQCYNIFV